MIKIAGITIRPEVEQPIYYLHLFIIAAIVLILLKVIFHQDMLSFDILWKSALLIGAGDIFAHSVLKLG